MSDNDPFLTTLNFQGQYARSVGWNLDQGLRRDERRNRSANRVLPISELSSQRTIRCIFMSYDEKRAQAAFLPLSTPVPSAKKARFGKFLILLAGITLCILKVVDFTTSSTYLLGDTNFCPQTDVLVPEKNNELWNDLTATIGSLDRFQTRAVDWLAGAVKVPLVLFPVSKSLF